MPFNSQSNRKKGIHFILFMIMIAFVVMSGCSMADLKNLDGGYQLTAEVLMDVTALEKYIQEAPDIANKVKEDILSKLERIRGKVEKVKEILIQVRESIVRSQLNAESTAALLNLINQAITKLK